LATLRNATISLFNSFDNEALIRAGVANGNIMSVRAAAYHIAGHELHHNLISSKNVICKFTTTMKRSHAPLWGAVEIGMISL
jgi:hypothetical protein